LRFQRGANCANATVHHVAGRDDVHAGLGLRQGLLHEHFNGGIVQDVAAVVKQSVLAVAGVGVECDIGHHAQLGKMFFQRTHHVWHQSVWVGGLSTVRCFEVTADDGKQSHHRNAQFDAFFGHGQQQI
jgi:hypothetical protein